MKKKTKDKEYELMERRHRMALSMLGAGKRTVEPCKNLDLNCANCKFYILEGLLNWYNEVLKVK